MWEKVEKFFSDLKVPLAFFLTCLLVWVFFGPLLLEGDEMYKKGWTLVIFLFVFGYFSRFAIGNLEKGKKEEDLEKSRKENK